MSLTDWTIRTLLVNIGGIRKYLFVQDHLSVEERVFDYSYSSHLSFQDCNDLPVISV